MRMVLIFLTLLPLEMFAQDRVLAPLARGVLQQWTGSDTGGSLLFQTDDQREHNCLFTNRTYFERDHKRTFITKITPGQQVEMLSERVSGDPACRALIVRILTETALQSPRYDPSRPANNPETFPTRKPRPLTREVSATPKEPGSLAPLTRGVFRYWAGAESGGTFDFQTPDEYQHRCNFTVRTYFEREHKRTSIRTLEDGQPLEVLSEPGPGTRQCTALIVRILTETTLQSARYQSRASSRIATETFAPRGNLIFTGVIVQSDDKSFIVRTREGSRHLIQIRKDTSFLAAGDPSTLVQMPFNKPVQVRAGKTFDNDIEAFSVVWGQILQPIAR